MHSKTATISRPQDVIYYMSFLFGNCILRCHFPENDQICAVFNDYQLWKSDWLYPFWDRFNQSKISNLYPPQIGSCRNQFQKMGNTVCMRKKEFMTKSAEKLLESFLPGPRRRIFESGKIGSLSHLARVWRPKVMWNLHMLATYRDTLCLPRRQEAPCAKATLFCHFQMMVSFYFTFFFII